MTTTNSIPTESALKQNQVIEIAGGFKVINQIYDDIFAVGRSVDEALDNFNRKIKILRVKWDTAKRREQCRKEWQERKQYARK